LQDQLKRHIETACGRGIRNVQVVLAAQKHVMVRFTTRTEADAARYAVRIREMPELAAFTIDDVAVTLMP